MKNIIIKGIMWELINNNLYVRAYRRIKTRIYWARERARLEREFAEIPAEPVEVG